MPSIRINKLTVWFRKILTCCILPFVFSSDKWGHNYEQCDPYKYFKVPMPEQGTRFTTNYCTDKNNGFNVKSDDDKCQDARGYKALDGTNQVCAEGTLHINFRTCQCTTYTCSGNPGACKCASDFSERTWQCYRTTKPCEGCPLGQYRSNCGCIDAPAGVTTTPISIFSHDVPDCNPGTCIACPKGYACPGGWNGDPQKSFYAVKCKSNETYQGEQGKDHCITCRIPDWSYRLGSEGCGGGISTGLSIDNFKSAPCTGCDDDSNALLSCRRDWSQYKNAKGECKQCANHECNHPFYYVGIAGNKYCHKRDISSSDPIDSCAKWYLDIVATSQEKNHENFQQNSNDYKNEKMPWKAGFKRVIPLRPRAVFGTLNYAGLKGQVPFYMKCSNLPKNTSLYTYIGPGDSNYEILQNDQEYAESGWMEDCNQFVILKCKDTATEYYSEKDTMQLKIRSKDCAPCGQGESGLEYKQNTTQCECPQRNANTSIHTDILKSGIYQKLVSVIDQPLKCPPCAGCHSATPSFLTILNQQYYCINFMCKNNTLTKFLEKEYYDIRSKKYQTCGTNSFPNNNRSGCVFCPSARQKKVFTETYLGITFYECADCNWAIEYENANDKTCIQRKTSCPNGTYMVRTENKNEDHKCVQCAEKCKPGSIRITSQGRKHEDFTCQSESWYNYGCITLQDMQNYPFALDVAWNFNYDKQTIEQQVCDLDLIPRYSYWVMYSPTYAQNKKLSCYFACLHGVNKNEAEEIYGWEWVYMENNYQDETKKYSKVDYDVPGNIQNSDTYVEIKRKKYRPPISSSTNTGPSIYWYNDYPEEMQRTVSKFRGNTFYYNTDLFQQYSKLYSNLCKSPQEAYGYDDEARHCDETSLLDSNPEENMPDKNMMNDYIKNKKNTDILIKCAYDARVNLLSDDSNNLWVYSPNTQKLACRVRDLQYPYASYDTLDICKENCYEKNMQNYWNEIENIEIPSKKSNAYALSQWLFWKSWSLKDYDPYIFDKNSKDRTCSFQCDSQKTFKLDIAISNSKNVHVCVEKTDDNSLTQYCKIEKESASYITDATANEVTCQQCLTFSNAILLMNTDPQWQTWYTEKSNNFSSQRTQLNAIQCRYQCKTNYHSTKNFDQLTTAPCESCPLNENAVVCPNSLTSGAYFKILPSCNSPTFTPKNFNPEDVCRSCTSPRSELQSYLDFQPGKYLNNDECMTRCKDGFLTFQNSELGRQNPLSAGEWIKNSEIYECRDCSLYPGYQCPNRFCQEGTVNVTGGLCQQCTYTRCADFSQYRTICVLNQNSQCKSCNKDYLKNSDRITRLSDAWYSAMPQADINSIRRLLDEHSYNITRKYVQYSESSGVPIMKVRSNDMAVLQSNPRAVQCALACANNYFWMDIRTGRSPFEYGYTEVEYDHQYFVCFPCQSVWFYGTSSQTRYIRLDMASQVYQWYSIWNQSKPNDVNFTQLLQPFKPGTLAYNLSFLQNLKGSCYPCARFHHLTGPDSTTLCSSRIPGYAETVSSNLGTLTLNNPLPNAPITSTQIRTTLSQFTLNPVVRTRRRLLQMTGEEIQTNPTPALLNENVNVIFVRNIKVKKHPAFYNTDDYSTCCERVFPRKDDQQNCKKRKLHSFEQKITQIGREYGEDYCDNVVGLTKAQVNRNVIKPHSPQATRRLLQYTSVPPSISIENVSNQEVNISVSNLSVYSQSVQIIVQIDDGLRCPAGQFKESNSIGNCEDCPYGSSTIYPFTGSSSRYDCRCLDGFKRVFKEITPISQFNFTCDECGRNFYRSYSDPSFDNNDTYCKPCPENMTTPTATSSFCYCIPGLYYDFNQSRCLECPMDSYCDKGIQYFCPMYSRSPPMSSRRKQCICESATHYGNLEMDDSQCFPLKPGFECPAASVTCKCALNWTLKVAADNPSQTRCETPCVRGQYARLDPSNHAVLECVKCPKGKYSSEFQALSNTSCVSCPPLMTTQSAGSANVSDCSCSDRNSSATAKDDCSSCKQGFYYDPTNDACVQCPSGLSSFQGSTGIQSCFLCPMGQRTVALRENAFACEPCPLGFFSMSVGTKCTICPKGYTTLNVGSVSSLACVPFGTSSSSLF